MNEEGNKLTDGRWSKPAQTFDNVGDTAAFQSPSILVLA